MPFIYLHWNAGGVRCVDEVVGHQIKKQKQMPIIYHILIFATTKALALDRKDSTAWPGVGTVGPCHGALSIWQHGIAQPSPSWSEANSPTPQCRILGIAAHGDAVMCHLALGPAGQELSLTSPLKLVCHWGPRQGESPRTTCMHSPHDADRLEGDCRHLLGKVFSFFLPPAWVLKALAMPPAQTTAADQRLFNWSRANKSLCLLVWQAKNSCKSYETEYYLITITFMSRRNLPPK